MAEGVTIRDVAAEAKVSIATVSRVLNGGGNVKESTRERVCQAVRRVGYALPEALARQDGSKTILIMVTHVDNMYTGKQIEGILSAANYSGYDCVIFKRKSEVYELEQIIGIAESVNACGILISWPNIPAEIINRVAERYPVVQINEYCEDSNVPFVSVDDYGTGKTATNYLLKLGYRKIGIMNGVTRFKYTRERYRGYQDALREFGIEPLPEYSFSSSSALVEPIIDRIINVKNPPEAIVTTSDLQAAGLIKALHAVGKSIPEDMAIVSCEDTELAQYVSPPLTTVSHPIFHIGEEACRMLLDIMSNHKPSPDQIFLKSDLVVRGTT